MPTCVLKTYLNFEFWQLIYVSWSKFKASPADKATSQAVTKQTRRILTASRKSHYRTHHRPLWLVKTNNKRNFRASSPQQGLDLTIALNGASRRCLLASPAPYRVTAESVSCSESFSYHRVSCNHGLRCRPAIAACKGEIEKSASRSISG